MTSISSASRIRDLNDAMRNTGISSGRWMMTAGVQALGPEFILLATRAVQTFSAFTDDNDPYGEHDFGSFIHPFGGKVFWKIDYYDHTLTCGSEDPTNPDITTRVLTIMLACEY